MRPRIRKSYELLAYLAGCEGREADREELLGALFDGRSDDSTRSYLRQALHRLRQVLPDAAELAFEGSRLQLGDDVALVSEFARVEGLLAQAARLQGGERLGLLLQALESLDRGEYLAGVHSVWVDERRSSSPNRGNARRRRRNSRSLPARCRTPSGSRTPCCAPTPTGREAGGS